MNLNTITENMNRRMISFFAVIVAMFMCFAFPAPAAFAVQDVALPAVTAEYSGYGYSSSAGGPQIVTLANTDYINQETCNYYHTTIHPNTLTTASQMPGMAVPLSGTTLHTDLDLDALFGGVIDIILKMGLYVGGALTASGVFQLLLSYYNDQPEGKAAALRLTVVGGALMGMRGLLQLIGLIG